MRSGPAHANIGVQSALKKLAYEHTVFRGNDVADQDPLKASRQFGREVASLVGVRKQYQIRTDLSDERLERRRVPVSRIVREQRMLNRVHAGNLLRRGLSGQRTPVRACDSGFYFRPDLLRRRK